MNPWNDAEDWIFSEEAHLWMDSRRHLHAAWNAPTGPYGSAAPREGWEHGLFGFKNLDLTCNRRYKVTAEDRLPDMIYL